MLQNTLFVCTLCLRDRSVGCGVQPADGQQLYEQLTAKFQSVEPPPEFKVESVRCLGACSFGCVVAFAAPGKLTFVLKDLNPCQSIPDLLEFTQQYQRVSDGKVPYQQRPTTIRQSIHAVLPPLPTVG
jgi:predicted metal-binding protein